jgi:hypothetical protein
MVTESSLAKERSMERQSLHSRKISLCSEDLFQRLLLKRSVKSWTRPSWRAHLSLDLMTREVPESRRVLSHLLAMPKSSRETLMPQELFHRFLLSWDHVQEELYIHLLSQISCSWCKIALTCSSLDLRLLKQSLMKQLRRKTLEVQRCTAPGQEFRIELSRMIWRP